MKALLESTVTLEAVDQLISGLQSNRPNKHLSRCAIILQSLDGYIQRLESKYSLYRDCIQPHVNGLKIVRAVRLCGVRQCLYVSIIIFTRMNSILNL